MRLRYIPFFLISASLFLTSCVVDPATKQKEFTPFLTPESEASLGQEEHQKTLAVYGGEYRHGALNGYVRQIADKIARNSGLPKGYFKVTLLNSEIPNAFALPGGYLYITRGMLALINSEAELAGILGHEQGHVIERHGAKRMTNSIVSSLLAAGIGVVSDNKQLEQVAGLGGQGVVAHFSRQDELAADKLGIKLASLAGYNPNAQADFLRTLKNYTEFNARKSGTKASDGGFFATHPNTEERVKQAIAFVNKDLPDNVKNAAKGENKDAYLKHIEGLIYGQDQKQGVVKGQTFIHSDMGFKFTAPQGFKIVNMPSAVVMQSASSMQILFDGVSSNSKSPLDYISREWKPELKIHDVQSIKMNGIPAATGWTSVQTQKGVQTIYLAALTLPWNIPENQMLRFMLVTPESEAKAAKKTFTTLLNGFHRLAEAEKSQINSLHLRIYKVKEKESFESLAKNLPFAGYGSELLRIINNYDRTEKLKTGDIIKIIK